MNPVKIIKATTADALSISIVGRQSFSDAFASIFQSKQELGEYLDRTYDPLKIERSIGKENNVFFLALVNNVPVGFAKLKKSSLEPQIESIAQMELQKIYVLTEYHGSGAAAALMNTIIEYASEVAPDYLWLHVHLGNEKAFRFYKKHGFRIAGRHSFTIGTQNFDFHMMCLPIAITQLSHF